MEKTRVQGLQAFEELFKAKNYEYVSHTHDAAINMETMLQVVQPKHSVYIKNLFYQIKKGDKGFALLFAQEDTQIKKDFWKLINKTSNQVRLGKGEDLDRVLGCYPGCVNPLSVVNDAETEVKVIIGDQKLKEQEWVAFHPCDNTATIELKREDFEAFITDAGYKIHYLDLEIEGVAKEPAQKGQKGGKGGKKNKKAKQQEEGTKLKIMYEKEKDFANWYTEIIKKGDMIEYYDVSGCYVIKPHAYFIWENIQNYLDARFKEVGTRNTYFPMFVSKDKLETEKDHVEGFKAEVAWVTKAGDTDLPEPIAIRPTSETIMYPIFAKWIRSHRDLPIIINQWTNVVRWEFSNPTPFIRTREFLWQEGHTAHESLEEADTLALKILDSYAECYKEVLSVPVIKGKKSNLEKFAGGDWTYTCETLSTVNGRSIQACTSHMLGQNFAKMFKVNFQNKEQKKDLVWQTSWGFSTRSIGAFVLVHSDNKGLVLTPNVADIQIMIIPIYTKKKLAEINEAAFQLRDTLRKAGVRVSVNDRDNESAGFRFNDAEIRGIPIRIEIGPKDIEKNQCVIVRRFDGDKQFVSLEGIEDYIQAQFKDIGELMYQRASERMAAKQKTASDWPTFMEHLNNGNIILTPWCDNDVCENTVKTNTGTESKANASEGDCKMTGKAKTLCKPLDQEPVKEGECCFACSEPAKCYVYWGRSY